MPERTLPVLASRAQKLAFGLLAIAACVLFYTVPSALTLQRASLLDMPAWERAIPYIPQTVWPYLAQYPLLAAAYLGCRDLARCTRFLYAVVIVQATAGLLFLLAPLRYPRELHEAAAGTDAVTLALATWVRGVDAPVNCCPSLHVTSCILSMCLVGLHRTPLSIGCGVVALASMASTLTFKQHYAIDLAAGALLAAAGWWAAGYFLPRPSIRAPSV
jgi:membrane-associated phospholipid phosphatase